MNRKVYRLHHCNKKHRSFKAFAECVFPEGNNLDDSTGEYAVVRWCKPPRWAKSRKKFEYSLHPTLESAQTRLNTFFQGRCKGECTGNHELIRLEIPHQS